MSVDLRGEHFASLADFTSEELEQLIDLSLRLKQERYIGNIDDALENLTLAMIFEKPSLRTRVSFEVAMNDLGGRAIYLAPTDIALGERETIEDTAIVLSSMCHTIMARVFEHSKIEELCEHSSVPVINGLSDLLHPMQGLADFMTIKEKLGTITGRRLCFLGDGNNVAHSLMLGGAILGCSVTVCCAQGYEPAKEIVKKADELAKESGARMEVNYEPERAVADADVVYTDVWASMGQEKEAKERVKALSALQVTEELFAKAAPQAILLHCLPAHYSEELTYDVSRHPRSAIFPQAENRLHTAKAVLLSVM